MGWDVLFPSRVNQQLSLPTQRMPWPWWQPTCRPDWGCLKRTVSIFSWNFILWWLKSCTSRQFIPWWTGFWESQLDIIPSCISCPINLYDDLAEPLTPRPLRSYTYQVKSSAAVNHIDPNVVSPWQQRAFSLVTKRMYAFFGQNLWMIIKTDVCKRHGWRIVVVSYVMFFQVFERMRRCWNWCLFFLEMWISTGCPWIANSIHNVVHDEPRSSRNKRQPCLAGAMRHCLVCYKKGLVLSSESVK